MKSFLQQIDSWTYCTCAKNENDIINSSLFIKDQSFIISNTEECRTVYCNWSLGDNNIIVGTQLCGLVLDGG